MFADCCESADDYLRAVMASLKVSFLKPVPPNIPAFFRAWTVKTEGRKTFLEGSIDIPQNDTGDMVVAVQAEALFVWLKETCCDLCVTSRMGSGGLKRLN
jgi:hypothetical protein